VSIVFGMPPDAFRLSVDDVLPATKGVGLA